MKGIYPRENSIQVYFKVEGKTYRETVTGTDGTPLEPTPKNLAYADKLRQRIMRAIATETFKLSEFFPHSRTGRGEKQKLSIERPSTVTQAVEAFLASKERKVAKTTHIAYRSALRHLTNNFGDSRITSIDFVTLDGYMNRLKCEAGTHNSLLSVMNVFFEYCIKARLITENPVKSVERLRAKRPDPDPLLPEEVSAILSDMKKHYNPQIANYFELAFMIGARPSEMVDLKWENLDESKGSLLINSAKVWGIVKDVKTHRDRFVELDQACMSVIQRQKEHTFMKQHGRIFDNPSSGKPWFKPTDLHSMYWVPSLKRCKIRARDSRQTRHTCATFMLMSGCREQWAAAQLGHSVEIFRNVYSKWMPEIDAGTERGKMAGLFTEGENFTGNSLKSASH